MKRYSIGRWTVSLLLVGADCLFLLTPFARGAQAAQRDKLLQGGEFVLVAAYSEGAEKRFYAMGTTLDRRLKAVPVSSETAESELPVWTVQPAGDGVSLSVDGCFLGCDGNGGFSGGEIFVWNLIQSEHDGVRFCTDAGQAIAYNHNEGNGRFGIYDLSEDWDSQYQFDLLVYPLTEDVPEETTQPEETAPPAIPVPEGTGILWLKGQNVALCGTMDASGYLTGTAVSENQGTLTGYGSSDFWTIRPESGNQATLLHSGKALSLPEDGVVFAWDGAHPIWELLSGEDGTWLIRNASFPDRYLGWNPVLKTWQAGNLPETGQENYSFSFTTAEPDVVLPAAETVSFTPDGGELYPQGGGSVTLTTETPGGEIYYATSSDGITYGEYSLYTQPICPEPGFGRLWVKAYTAAPGYKNSPETVCAFTERTGYYGFYFGQLHAHTAASDGLGNVEEAFTHAAQVENLDFFAVTDHSNSFDNDTLGGLTLDGTAISREWQAGKAAAAAVTDGFFVGLYGFEMSWNNGLGHISTFCTPGWASRNQGAYQDLNTALENYYGALTTVPGSVSQFNHPGDAHGDFENFAHYSTGADRAITLMEVFNSDTGDAYDAYIRALDLGWHLAPTCNQDNHSGAWGSLDSGRTVVLANTLTEQNLLEAMQTYRVYATKDSDLRIFYTLDGSLMGSRLFDYGEQVTIQVSLTDGTDGNSAFLEVIGSGGTVAVSRTIHGAATLTLPSGSPYYLLRLTQADGDVALTAPVWLEQEPPLEIISFGPEGNVIVAGEPQNFNVEITNLPASEAVITVTDGAGNELATQSLPGADSTAWSFVHSFPEDGVYTLTVTVTAGGRTTSRELTIPVMPRNILSDVIVDGTHGASVAADHLIAVAEAAGFKAHVEKHRITASQLDACSVLIIPAPNGDFEPEFMELAAKFSTGGGSVLLCGSADKTNPGAAARINALLASMGSTMTLSDDLVYDPKTNGGTPDVVFSETVNENSPWTEGIREGQVYSHRGGCSVNIGSGDWLVKAPASAFSIDGDGNGLERNGEIYREILLDDNDGSKEVICHLVKSAGEICLLAAEDTAGGMVFLSGSGLPFDESMQFRMDNLWDLPYANRTIFEQILGIPVWEPCVTSVAQVRSGETGKIFLIEGYVTAGTANPHNRLPQTIYIQDETAGIALAPYTDPGLELGTKVHAAGVLRRVNGDIQLELLHLSALDVPGNLIAPAILHNEAAMHYGAFGGLLVKIRGTVTDVTYTADGLGVTDYTLVDEAGVEARVLVEDTIRSGSTGLNHLAGKVRAGNRVSVTGLVYQNDETVLRMRNCDELILLWAPDMNPTTGDDFPLAALVCVMAMLLLGIGLLRKKKRT